MLEIKAEKRTVFGKKLESARRDGKLPIVVYGAKDQPVSLFVSGRDFKKVLSQAGESTVITVDAGALKKDVLIHEVAFHPVNGEPLHADFYVVDKTKTIKIKVPLRFEGIAPAVKDLGGILVKVLHELEIEVLPLAIPHDLPVAIDALATLESQILVKDLNLPPDIKVINQPDEVVASIGVAKEEPVEEAPVDLAAIEVDKKGKKEEIAEGAETAEVPVAEEGKK